MVSLSLAQNGRIRGRQFFNTLLKIESATEKQKIPVLRSIFELATRALPNDAQLWLQYVQFEMQTTADYSRALAIYHRVMQSAEVSSECKNQFSKQYHKQ